MRSETEIRTATRTDFIRYFGYPPPEVWHGVTAVKGDFVLGVAGIALWDDGNWWGFVDSAPLVRTPALFHRRAIRFMREFPVDIRVLCDERFQRARVWLERLGFTETDEEHNGCKVWMRNGRV